jgi:transposase
MAMLRKIGAAQVIDEALGPPMPGPQVRQAQRQGQPPPEAGPSVGQCVEAMVLNILEGRVALMNMEQWLRGIEVGTLFDISTKPDQFTDDRLARALDDIYEIGLDGLYTGIVANVIQRFQIPMKRLHDDGTTIKVYGEYNRPAEEKGPQARRGHSKDHRPDLLQFVFGMMVQQDGIPICSDMLDGNTTDQSIYRAHLERVRPLVANPGETTFVGDCKVCDAKTLGALRNAGFHVTTLLPKTYSLWGELVQQALAQPQQWEEVVRRAGRTSKDAEVVHRGCVLPCTMKLEREQDKDEQKGQDKGEQKGQDKGEQKGQDKGEQKGQDKGEQKGQVQWEEPFRAVVVHSSELERTQGQAQVRQIERERVQGERQMAQQAKREYSTEQEAQQGAQRWLQEQKVQYWTYHTEVRAENKSLKRGRRGRPKAGEEPPQVTVYRVHCWMQADEAARQQAARQHGIYILVTSHLDASAVQVWTDYRGQKEVEGGFRWLKAPGQIAPIFLHTPSRVAAMGMVFTVALLLYRLMQWQLRSNLEKTGATIPGHHGQPTQKPTMAQAMNYFNNIYVIHIETKYDKSRVLVGLSQIHYHIMELLDISPEIYGGSRMPQRN